jgi:hypothetical protein
MLARGIAIVVLGLRVCEPDSQCQEKANIADSARDQDP